jgi:hypothetical protein
MATRHTTMKKKEASEISQQVAREHAQRHPDGCPQLCVPCVARLGLSESEVARRNRERIARLFKHGGASEKGGPRG